MDGKSQEKIRPQPLQVKAARVLLNNMTQDALAEAAGISVEALIKFENSQIATRDSTVDKLREALERRGIEFTNGDEPGVKLRPSKAIIPN